MPIRKKYQPVRTQLTRHDPQGLEPDLYQDVMSFPTDAAEAEAFRASGASDRIRHAARRTQFAERLKAIKATFQQVWADEGLPPMHDGVLYVERDGTYSRFDGDERDLKSGTRYMTTWDLVADRTYEPAWYAAHVFQHLRTLEVLLKNPRSAEDAASIAMKLGVVVTEYRLRQDWGPDAVAARKSRIGGSMGRQKVLQKTEPERNQKYAKVRYVAAKLQRADSSLTAPKALNRLATRVAHETGVPRTTCLRILGPGAGQTTGRKRR